jgi:ABC-2 type transport system ATP-binding protein
VKKETIIAVRGLKKRYKGSRDEALRGIDLEIASGDFFGLLGPNAAGKSTLISILCGTLSHTSGEIVVFGESLYRRSTHFKRRIGLVPQEIALYPALTVFENIRFFGHLHGLSGTILKERAAESIRLFHLEEHRHKLISKCSGGIKRRVNLIAGVIHEPRLILLDEPTLGVDPQLRSLIFDFLSGLNRAGATLIYTTHYMEEAETLCNRVSIIDHGSILREGSPEGLIASEPGCSDLGQLFINLTGRDLRD